VDEITFPIPKGTKFLIVIEILLSGYTIYIDKMRTIQIETNTGRSLPPWSADHIIVSQNTAINHGEKFSKEFNFN
jgi:hypothetical protein